MNSQRSEKTNTGSIPSNLKQSILNLSKKFTRKSATNSLTSVNQPAGVSINADHFDETDQWQNVADFGDQLLHDIAVPMSADHDAELSPVQSFNYDQSSSSAQHQFCSEHVNFDEYWRTVLSSHQQKSDHSETFNLKVPPKVGINDQKINDLDGIPLPYNFMVNCQSDITTPFLEKQLLGDVQITYNVAPEHKFFYAFLYKSPQQIMDNLNKTDEIDIVWTFGVILYGMLSNNEHPFENLPIPYDNVMPTDFSCDNDEADDQYVCINEYEPLINLTKQCLQTYKDKRILMSDLRKQLEEISCG
uniref:Protein kinase domain-containing protein n=1 Tax=Globodera rostochiensis TaxID=31243 RepID=A0A914H7S5_GLORO